MSDAIQQAIKNLEWIKESARIGGRHGSWTKAQEAIEALQAMQSTEPAEWVIEVENGQVVMSRIGANFTGYLYTTQQPPTTKPIAAVKGWFHGECIIQALDPAAVLPAGMALYAAPQPVVDRNELIELLIATRTQSEGVTADLIIKLLKAGGESDHG
jgi:hypothetical protein